MKKKGKIIFSIAIIIIECLLLFIYIESFVYYVNNANPQESEENSEKLAHSLFRTDYTPLPLPSV